MKFITSLSLLLLLIVSHETISRPQYTLLTGNKCLNCHVQAQGGGARNLLGWYSKSSAGMFQWEDVGLGKLYEFVESSNEIIPDKLSVGWEMRSQVARLGGRPEGSERELFGMQFAPSIVFSPFKSLTFDAYYNLAGTLYSGQGDWSASVTFKPDVLMPYIRAGYFSPHIVTKYDDHTMFIKGVADTTGRMVPVLPPDNSEFGAELRYDGLKWLSLSAGLFTNDSISSIGVLYTTTDRVQFAEQGNLAQVYRVGFLPRFWENRINTHFGGAYYTTEGLDMYSAHVNIGWEDKAAIMTEYVIAERDDAFSTDNYHILLTYKLTEYLYLEGRYEKATTEVLANNSDYSIEQYVLGGRLFPLPFIEIRPEYRIYDTERYDEYAAQWAVQFHLFY